MKIRNGLKLGLFMLFLAGFVNAEIEECDMGDVTVCSQANWGEDPGIGNYGGRAAGDFDLVVAPGDCSASTWSSTLELTGGVLTIEATGNAWQSCDTYGQLAIAKVTREANDIYIEHLDGIGDDSFKVFWNGDLICHYDDSSAAEVWLTKDCDISTISTDGGLTYVFVGDAALPEFPSASIPLLILIAAPAIAYFGVRRFA